ncbi:hypothetical protein GJAV_G00240800 [Gymnothorax javanicus]|nr:hypothetical protein GJAV_G00240800 [Gymnothorax javanicus]
MENATMHCLSTQGLVSKVVPPVFIVEFVIGLPANVLALWIFCCRMRTWGSTAVFLLNLLIADFFLLASVPFRIDYFLRVEDWVFGDAWCRINLFALAVNRSASIAFMTIVAIDRYFKVVHPHHMVNQLTKAQAGMLSGLTWTVLLSLRLPLLANQLLHPDKLLNTTLCRSFSSYGTLTAGLKLHYGLYFFEFFIPFLLLIFCSLRIVCFLRHRQLDRKQKVKRAMHVVLLIVAVFTICFLPGIASGLTALSIQKLRPKTASPSPLLPRSSACPSGSHTSTAPWTQSSTAFPAVCSGTPSSPP